MAARKAQVALFLTLLLAPLLATLGGSDGANPLVENRTMAAFPHLDGTWASLADLPHGFTAWFEDHFAFRSTLVRWDSEARYFGLGVSPSSGVVKGSDGWLYYGDDWGMDDYTRETILAPKDVLDWRESIVRSQDWLRQRHIAFVFTIAPDKHMVYPEALPAAIRPVGQTYAMDQLFESLQGTDVATVDVRPALLSAKSRERLYEKTDTHWNERGAFVAYRELIHAIRAQTPSVPPAWERDDFAAVEYETDAMDLAGMIGLKDVLRETRLRLLPKRPRRARVIEPPGELASANVGRLVTEIADPSLPRAVVFRDSFGSRLAPFVAEHFRRTVFLWQNNFDTKVIEEEHPDVVVQEIVGRHLLYITPYSNASTQPSLAVPRGPS
jgi:alginate O-acetyltransferase complex protein AlgJ